CHGCFSFGANSFRQRPDRQLPQVPRGQQAEFERNSEVVGAFPVPARGASSNQWGGGFVTAARCRAGKGEVAWGATESARSSRAGPSRRDSGVGRARTVCPTEVRGGRERLLRDCG